MAELGSNVALPKKRYFRCRAHVNPLTTKEFQYPKSPESVNLSDLFPLFPLDDHKIEFLDLGCGYGGLLCNEHFPDKLMLGIEIRKKVHLFTKKKLEALQVSGLHKNIAFIRTNVFFCLPFYFQKAQLSKIFILFPDPHFKKKKFKWRIVNQALLDQYAYILKLGGLLYTITDVEIVHEWMCDQISKHPLFATVSQEELESDYVATNLHILTDEGVNVQREGGKTYKAIFKRIKCLPPLTPFNR